MLVSVLAIIFVIGQTVDTVPDFGNARYPHAGRVYSIWVRLPMPEAIIVWDVNPK